jgi:lipopolysaccharide/colanic/teichoic acid biosynthesis glycosyltransferase
MSSPTVPNPVEVAQRKRILLLAKRAIDILGAGLAIILLSPTFLVVALLIKLHDRGPVILRRRMVGNKGEFRMLKFRSMCLNADEVLRRDPALWREYQKNFKLDQDPRITPVGRVIRRYSLDELPQLFNVLRGDMSLVGPRSITHEELGKYGDFRQLLQTVKPGLSGYWQTEGRSRVSYEERVSMDVYYIRNWSLLLDLKILLKTPLVVLRADGAC